MDFAIAILSGFLAGILGGAALAWLRVRLGAHARALLRLRLEHPRRH